MKSNRLMIRMPPITTAASAQSGALAGLPPPETTRRSIGVISGSIFVRVNRAVAPNRFSRRVRTSQSRTQNSASRTASASITRRTIPSAMSSAPSADPIGKSELMRAMSSTAQRVSWKRNAHVQILHEEGELVGSFFNLFCGRLAGAMPGLCLDANEHGRRPCLRALKCRRVLERMPRHYTIVMVCGRDQRRRVAGPRLDVVQRRIRAQNTELLRVVGRAVVRHPRPSDSELVEAKHIHHSNRRECRAEQLGSLIENSADEQPTVRAPGNRQLRRRRVLLANQIFGGRDEVV